MRILDSNNKEITSPDLNLGHLVQESVFVKHHDAVYAVAEQGHYKTIREYPNGGKDVEWVVDIPGVRGKDAWDEYEDIYRYTPYTAEELDEIEKKRNEHSIYERVRLLESDAAETKEALNMILSGVTE